MASRDEVDELLTTLEDADQRLRAVYRELADDPGRAEAHEVPLRELHSKRRKLAEQVGVAMLARRRHASTSPIRSAAARTQSDEPSAADQPLAHPRAEPP